MSGDTVTGRAAAAEREMACREAARRTVAVARRRVKRRTYAVIAALVLAVLGAFVAALVLGEFGVPLLEVMRSLARPLLGRASWESEFFVLDVRLPRVLTAVLSGAAFGLSGALFQSLIRNPLASPDVIGITSGASAAAVVCVLLLGLDGMAVSFGALAGALVTAALIYLLAWRRGVSGHRLVLVGIGIAAVLSSLISYLMTTTQISDAQRALEWLTGSLDGCGWPHAGTLALCLVLLLPATALPARSLRVLQFGDDTAAGLGVRVEYRRLVLLAVAVALAAVATAAAGPVPFVALVSAPIARGLLRGRGPALTAAALVGAVLMSASDFIGQHLFDSTELPVGVVTGVVGAPYLLLMVTTTNRSGGSG
ncbi:FecCD family ABC transporter permease [Streptantibioticus ferralitis]|uniref:Iron chelate uptake ABC transporter family permease subunit n=1 Tax=Streptantibioticus ferralitis TaxID=236510 RepID=A0ABT5ZC62_9ACTN|nr:iron chelate uptake ABC transporter family permease subunit [Streptantibioticus ferralitis]MDF2261283.1 iron chelate uptake ABC transporter family permease subunit [Streptantibioticus ferralitis]